MQDRPLDTWQRTGRDGIDQLRLLYGVGTVRNGGTLL